MTQHPKNNEQHHEISIFDKDMESTSSPTQLDIKKKKKQSIQPIFALRVCRLQFILISNASPGFLPFRIELAQNKVDKWLFIKIYDISKIISEQD